MDYGYGRTDRSDVIDLIRKSETDEGLREKKRLAKHNVLYDPSTGKMSSMPAAIAGGTAAAMTPAATTAATAGGTAATTAAGTKAGATAAGTKAGTAAGVSGAAASAGIMAGAMVIQGVQEAEAKRRKAALEDLMRMRKESVSAMADTQRMQDRALSAIDQVYNRYTT